MRKSALVLAAAVAMLTAAGSMPATPSVPRRRKPTPYPGQTLEHVEWNAEVERRKAEKKARKAAK